MNIQTILKKTGNMQQKTAKEPSVVSRKQQPESIPYTIQQLVQYVNDVGNTGGGALEVTGVSNGEDITIVIDQNEWNDTPVCFVGGYGHVVKTIKTEEVPENLPDILDYYFDKGATFKINRLN